MKYIDYLDQVQKLFDDFVTKAKKIKKNDMSKKNQDKKLIAVEANIKLRAFLQKFRGKACRCKED